MGKTRKADKLGSHILAAGILLKQLSKAKTNQKQMIIVFKAIKVLTEGHATMTEGFKFSLGYMKENRENIIKLTKQVNKIFHKMQTDIAELERQLKALKEKEKKGPH